MSREFRRAAYDRRLRWTRGAGLDARHGFRELEALRLVEQHPGITVAELAEQMGVSMQRAWQYVNRLEAGRVRLEPEADR